MDEKIPFLPYFSRISSTIPRVSGEVYLNLRCFPIFLSGTGSTRKIPGWHIQRMLISPISVFIEVYVDKPHCNGCGSCVDQCSMGVFRIDEEKAEPVQSQACIGCFKCLDFCPEKAIQTRWIMRA